MRALAVQWLSWLEQVRGPKPSTSRDHQTLLREPGEPYRRGAGTSRGLIMAIFGDAQVAEVTSRDVSRLRSLDEMGLKARNVNKYRQVLQAMFTYACRSDTFELPSNPVEQTDKRREPPPAALDYYEIEEVEALARVCERGGPPSDRGVGEDERIARVAEDCQDAEVFRILFYTGIRIGELLTLRWADVDLDARTLLVHRNLSAGLRRVKLHDLRHAAGSILARVADPVFVRDYSVIPSSARPIDTSARSIAPRVSSG